MKSNGWAAFWALLAFMNTMNFIVNAADFAATGNTVSLALAVLTGVCAPYSGWMCWKYLRD